MRIREIIMERISSKVYHYTTLRPAVQIISDGMFKLSSSVGASYESELNPQHYPYFLSTTRTRHGGYHDPYQDGVMFNLDGDFYNNRYKGYAVDYWGDRGKQHEYGRRSEAEDRIVSKEPELPIDGVTEIHVYLRPLSRDEIDKSYAYLPQLCRKLFIEAKKRNIPIYLYNDKKLWFNQVKSKSISIHDLELFKGHTKPKKMYRASTNYLEPWLELIYKNKSSDLSERGKKLSHNLTYYNGGDNSSYDADFSNARKPGNSEYDTLTKIIRYMRSNNLNKPSDLYMAMREKWKKIKESEYSS